MQLYGCFDVKVSGQRQQFHDPWVYGARGARVVFYSVLEHLKESFS